MQTATPLAFAAILVAAGCGSKSSAPSPNASASNGPASVASASKPAHPCPDDTTIDKVSGRCQSTGMARLLLPKWLGKFDERGAVFSVANTTAWEINHLTVQVYYYDKTGRQLAVKGAKYTESAGTVPLPIKPGETTEIAWGYRKEHLPAEVAIVEAEVRGVGWVPVDGKRDDTFGWNNMDLMFEDRAPGGTKLLPAASGSASKPPPTMK